MCLLLFEQFETFENGRQVVGWPPIRTYRMNSMVNQAKASATEDPNLEISQAVNKNRSDSTKMRNSMFVKVTMDGIPIGRKIDLNAHKCYESLSNTLEEMFLKPKLGVLFESHGLFFGSFEVGSWYGK
jgi:auxin-responsive protein IAA